jgi:hypothetical protein
MIVVQLLTTELEENGFVSWLEKYFTIESIVYALTLTCTIFFCLG